MLIGFLVFSGIIWIINLYLIFRLGPKYGNVHPAIYLTITAIGSAYLVAASQGFGVALVYSINNWRTDNELLMWEFYVLGVFVILLCVFQIDYLNRALKYFSASIVTPLNFVFMSTTTLVTTSVLYQGFQVGNAVTAITIIIGFLVIVLGVTLLLQYNLKLSKIDTVRESRDTQSIEDKYFREIDYDFKHDNPFSMINKTYSLHSSRVEPFGGIPPESSAIVIDDLEVPDLQRKATKSTISLTPSDPVFDKDGNRDQDGNDDHDGGSF